jgi:hypothetical protein
MSSRDMSKDQNQRMLRAANERMQEAIDAQVPYGTVIPFCASAQTMNA